MPIERAPYLIYSEQVSTVNYLNQTGADVVAILAPTKFAKLTSAGAIETETVEGETSTKWYEPTIAEDEILIFNRYSVAEQMVQSEELKKVLKDFFLENSYYSAQDNLGVNAVMVVPLPTTTTGSGQSAVTHPTVEEFLNAYKLLRKYRKVTAIGCVGLSNPQDIVVSLRQYLMEDQEEGNLKIAYIKAPARGNDETITAYATRIANLNQKHTEGTGNEATTVDGANSSRIAFIEPTFYGTLLAKICNTQYYLEPGYLPINSISAGEFEVLSSEERDMLCMSGLIFGEDDVLLPTTTPRICLGVSSAFGRPYSATAQNYDTRPADALLHARRNVDHHVREILGILAYQLKRNETSVTLRYVKNEVMGYLESELNNGSIQAYEFNVVESSYNPYCLLVTGAIVPVNSTLAVEFSNYIGAPYSIASNYV